MVSTDTTTTAGAVRRDSPGVTPTPSCRLRFLPLVCGASVLCALLSTCGMASDAADDPSPSPPVAGLRECEEAAHESSDLIDLALAAIEAEVSGDRLGLSDAARDIEAALPSLSAAHDACQRFRGSTDPAVQACGNASYYGGKTAVAMLDALESSHEDSRRGYIAMAEFYLEQYSQYEGECFAGL